jgi:predicted nucleotide-binding protein
MVRDMEYIFEVRANSELKVELSEAKEVVETADLIFRVFISHGRSTEWREVQAFIEKDLKMGTLELAQEPNRGRTVLQKLNDEAAKCSFAVVVMTGDDDFGKGAPRARENVVHEIGFFQGKLGLESICLLHEEGTSIPSNIHGLVYVPFPKGLITASFGVLGREINAAVQKSS